MTDQPKPTSNPRPSNALRRLRAAEREVLDLRERIEVLESRLAELEGRVDDVEDA